MTRAHLIAAPTLALALLSVGAGPPETDDDVGDEYGAWDSGAELDDASEPEIEPSVAPQLWDQADGLWLSLEMIGPRGAQLDAAHAVAKPPVVEALPRSGSPPPGELVGRVETLDEALTWIDAHAFSHEPEHTPVPGGVLLRDHGVVLTAMVVTGPNQPAGSNAETYPWPPAYAMPLPEGVNWRPASLAIARAPVFAAPAPSLPPAAERYHVARLDDAVWLLDERDSCSPSPQHCLRWARILVRHGDRFFGGYVPATWVVPDDAWVSGPAERRLALRPGHRGDGEVGFALIEQRGDRREAPVGLVHPHVGHEWPAAGVEVIGEQLVVLVGNETKLSRHLDSEPLPLLP